MYVRKAALLSSQIQGTQATLDDILYPAIKAMCVGSIPAGRTITKFKPSSYFARGLFIMWETMWVIICTRGEHRC